MKKMMHLSLIMVLVSLLTLTAHSQSQKTETPKWVSEKGYWVVEDNINDPFRHVIRFYNNDDVMIYKETLTGVRLNVNRKMVRMKLKQVLENSALAWEQKRVAEEEKQYVSAILK